MQWVDAVSGMSVVEFLRAPAFLFVSVIAPLVIVAVIFRSWKPRKPRDPTIKHVADSQITALIIYPIKSCGGIPCQACEYDAYGLKWDRRWMLVTKHAEHASIDDGKPEFKMLSQRQNPKMALFKPELTKDKLKITAPGKKAIEISLASEEKGKRVTLDLWGTPLIGIDEGDFYASWFSDFLGQQCRLMRMPSDHNRKVGEKFVIEGLKNSASYADEFPFLLTTNASLDDLNSRLTAPLPMGRFRPNIVVSLSSEDYKPFIEDTWRRFSLGNDIFFGAGPCSRCKLTTVDPTMGEFGGEEPLATLRKFRKKRDGAVYFGQHVLQEAERGTLRVGDRLKILNTKPTEEWEL